MPRKKKFLFGQRKRRRVVTSKVNKNAASRQTQGPSRKRRKVESTEGDVRQSLLGKEVQVSVSLDTFSLS